MGILLSHMACIKPYIENQKSTYNTIDISDLVQQVQIGYNKKKEFYFCIYTKKKNEINMIKIIILSIRVDSMIFTRVENDYYK